MKCLFRVAPSVKTRRHRVQVGNLLHAAERRCPGFFLFLSCVSVGVVPVLTAQGA